MRRHPSAVPGNPRARTRPSTPTHPRILASTNPRLRESTHLPRRKNKSTVALSTRAHCAHAHTHRTYAQHTRVRAHGRPHRIGALLAAARKKTKAPGPHGKLRRTAASRSRVFWTIDNSPRQRARSQHTDGNNNGQNWATRRTKTHAAQHRQHRQQAENWVQNVNLLRGKSRLFLVVFLGFFLSHRRTISFCPTFVRLL